MTNQVSSPKKWVPFNDPPFDSAAIGAGEKTGNIDFFQLGFKLSDEAIDGIFLAEAIGELPATNSNFRRSCSKFWDGKRKCSKFFLL